MEGHRRTAGSAPGQDRAARTAARRIAAVLLLLAFAPTTAAGLPADLRDPEDGWLDASVWLRDNAYGFLPTPIVITEPAVDNGLGMAALFLHADRDRELEPGEYERPSLSVAAGAYTGNDSWFTGGGHLGVWRDDTIRYLGAAGYASINLTYYGAASDRTEGLDRGLGFHSEGFVFLQNARFRIRGSQLFVGPEYQLIRLDSRFDILADLPVGPRELDATASGLGAVSEVDTRDSIFTPNRGRYAYLRAVAFGSDLGGDFTYQQYDAKWFEFLPLERIGVLGLRLDGQGIGGRPPFWARPFVVLRGIPAMRYQGDAVLVAEAELRWDFHPRVSALGFLGSGWAAADLGAIADAPARVGRGFGARYLVARQFSIRAGLDFAWGPDDFAAYLTMGQAWR